MPDAAETRSPEHTADGHRRAVVYPFHDAEQQRETATVGMWVFLASEILFFGAVFTGYVVYRGAYPEAWVEGSRGLHWPIGTANTAILLVSSCTMALAVRAAFRGARRQLVGWLLLTALLGTAFLGLKGYEWTLEILHGHLPGTGPAAVTEAQHRLELFHSFYFAMTGLHALHMVVGVGVLLGLVVLVRRGSVGGHRPNAVETAGLYWHFVDVVWIFLFPLFYLVERGGGG